MGFRGEALASIAGVAQVELKTKKGEDIAGTYIEIENSVVKIQQPVAAQQGTTISMKNLFFNVPARRNFLKSNASELRHIVDEFIRVSMAFPGIFFSLTSNGQRVFYLERGTLKQRIVQILGSTYSAKLVNVQEQTDYMNIYGFVGKPETAKKTRGDQYFFVNNRFIKSAYLNHAVMNAFSDMIAKDSFPMYALFIDLDPSRLDINVHPTKQEIKFEDEKIIYAFVKSAVKHALAQYSITPALDFDLDVSIQQSDAISQPFTADKRSAATASSLYNTFTQKHQAHFIESKSELKQWEKALSSDNGQFTTESQHSSGPDQQQKEVPKSEILESDEIKNVSSGFESEFLQSRQSKKPSGDVFIQIHNSMILAQNQTGFIAIHQQNAHERILYERFVNAMKGKSIATQRSLFPATIELAPGDCVLLNELLSDMQLLGYLVESFGNNTFVIQGTPADVVQGNEKITIERMLEEYKHFSNDLKYSKREKLLRSMACQQSIKPGMPLSQKEMKALTDDLFDCETPNSTPNGKPAYLEFKKDELDKVFGRCN
jgi:DNA mismatch repair protein MutL